MRPVTNLYFDPRLTLVRHHFDTSGAPSPRNFMGFHFAASATIPQRSGRSLGAPHAGHPGPITAREARNRDSELAEGVFLFTQLELAKACCSAPGWSRTAGGPSTHGLAAVGPLHHIASGPGDN
jgi:hypothetical protein